MQPPVCLLVAESKGPWLVLSPVEVQGRLGVQRRAVSKPGTLTSAAWTNRSTGTTGTDAGRARTAPSATGQGQVKALDKDERLGVYYQVASDWAPTSNTTNTVVEPSSWMFHAATDRSRTAWCSQHEGRTGKARPKACRLRRVV
jgi:hypothetical protein